MQNYLELKEKAKLNIEQTHAEIVQERERERKKERERERKRERETDDFLQVMTTLTLKLTNFLRFISPIEAG